MLFMVYSQFKQMILCFPASNSRRKHTWFTENYDEYIIDEFTGRLNYSTYEGHLWNSIYAALAAV